MNVTTADVFLGVILLLGAVLFAFLTGFNAGSEKVAPGYLRMKFALTKIANWQYYSAFSSNEIDEIREYAISILEGIESTLDEDSPMESNDV